MHSKISYDAKCSSIKYLIAWISVISQCWPLDNKQNFIGYVWTEVYWKKVAWNMTWNTHLNVRKRWVVKMIWLLSLLPFFHLKERQLLKRQQCFFFNFLWNVVYKGLSINCFLHKQKKLTLPFESVSVLL